MHSSVRCHLHVEHARLITCRVRTLVEQVSAFGNLFDGLKVSEGMNLLVGVRTLYQQFTSIQLPFCVDETLTQRRAPPITAVERQYVSAFTTAPVLPVY